MINSNCLKMLENCDRREEKVRGKIKFDAEGVCLGNWPLSNIESVQTINETLQSDVISKLAMVILK